MISNKEFVDQVIKNNEVYGLTLDNGYAMSLSNYFVDDNDDQIEMFCFWSSKSMTNSCILNEWSEYQVVSIKLSVFLEDWCIGTSNENYGLGLNFDSELTGVESDPLELLIDICKTLKEKKSKISFAKFKSVGELLDHAQKAIKYQD